MSEIQMLDARTRHRLHGSLRAYGLIHIMGTVSEGSISVKELTGSD
jgi:hypothetical protein